MAEREKLTVKGDYSSLQTEVFSLYLEYNAKYSASGQSYLRRDFFEGLKAAAKGGEKTPQELLIALLEADDYVTHSDGSGIFVATYDGGPPDHVGKPDRYLDWLRSAVKNDWFLAIGYSSLLLKSGKELTVPRARGGFVKDFDVVKDIVRLKTARGLRTYRLSEISWMQLFPAGKFPTVVEFRVTPSLRSKASWEIIFHESYERAGFSFQPREFERFTPSPELLEEPKQIYSSDRGFTTADAEALVGSVVVFRQEGRREVFTLAAVAFEEEADSTVELTTATGKLMKSNRFKDYLASRPSSK